jgi:2,5-dioxopentanoate dehydrogenase
MKGEFQMILTGELLIGAADVAAIEGTMKALNPATNRKIELGFALGGRAEVDLAVRLADEAFDSYSHTTLAARAAFLERIADNLDAVRTELAERAALETGLPAVQLEAEAAKATTQFRSRGEGVPADQRVFAQLSKHSNSQGGSQYSKEKIQ